MAVTHPTATRTAIAEAVRTIANAGTTPTLVIGTSSLSGETGVLCKITIPDFGAAASGVITSAANTNAGTATATGTAAICQVRADATGTVAFIGAVATSGAEVNITSTSITSGDTVTLTSNVVYTAPV
jgi:hypothetical protein